MPYFTLEDFVRESNRIEGIRRDPKPEEISAHDRFLAVKVPAVKDLVDFVSAIQPDAKLRRHPGLNVYVGNHVPPMGGPEIQSRLHDIVCDAHRNRGIPRMAYVLHHRYETLHPFTDGNGRSGRALWLWMMREAPLGFLHHWYYQSLEHGGLR